MQTAHTMLPVLILQHNADDGPAFLGTWLQAQAATVDLRHALAGQALPADMSQHAALAILGGTCSVNDPLPALRHEESLILDAMARGKPVIGHCLGGQLMARALGAAVGPSPLPEIGWHGVHWLPGAEAWFGDGAGAWFGDGAEAWFGDGAGAAMFQWHVEAFALPAGAQVLGSSVACPQQAFALGKHLAMQFHIELDSAKLAVWTQESGDAYRASRAQHPAQVQALVEMLRDAPARLAAQQAMAAHAYARWWAGV